ncbi:hypothetical protein D9M70_587360 [compost metagenome]
MRLGFFQGFPRKRIALVINVVVIRRRLFAVAVVRFVVDDHDVLHAHQIRHHALNHLSFSFKRLRIITSSPLEQLLATL